MPTKLTPEQQRQILYWPYTAGIRIIPADTRNKSPNSVKWWQNIDYTDVDFTPKLNDGEYDEDIAVVLGKTISNGNKPKGADYLIAFDLDGKKAVIIWFTDRAEKSKYSSFFYCCVPGIMVVV